MRAPIVTQKRAKALRRAMTQPEKVLWALLRRNRQQFHFRKQHAVGPYVLDFYVPRRVCASRSLDRFMPTRSSTIRGERSGSQGRESG